jgi:hypothetical protein
MVRFVNGTKSKKSSVCLRPFKKKQTNLYIRPLVTLAAKNHAKVVYDLSLSEFVEALLRREMNLKTGLLKERKRA